LLSIAFNYAISRDWTEVNPVLRTELNPPTSELSGTEHEERASSFKTRYVPINSEISPGLQLPRLDFCFCTNPTDIRRDRPIGSRQYGRMESTTDADLFLDAVDDIVLDVLARIGEDPDTRYALFKGLVVAAQAVLAQHAPETAQKPQ
jgi:hypothetical protein